MRVVTYEGNCGVKRVEDPYIKGRTLFPFYTQILSPFQEISTLAPPFSSQSILCEQAYSMLFLCDVKQNWEVFGEFS